MTKNVNITNDGIKISFTGEVKKENIIKMVENCATGSCECMGDKIKNKIKNITVSGVDGDVKLDLTGDISESEVKEAISKSKVLN